MFCKNCGTQIPDGAAFCPKCGSPVSQNQGGYQQQVHGEQFRGSTSGAGSYTGAPFGGRAYENTRNMQWYQFVTKLGLFGAAVVYLVFAIRTILGSAYLNQVISYIKRVAGFLGSAASELSNVRDEYSVTEIWDESGALHAVDIIVIICWFAMIVAAILVRQQLVQYKKDAPKHLTMLIIGSGGLYFLHSLLRQIIFSGLLREQMGFGISVNFMVLPIIGLIGAVVIAYLNHTYFAKRAALFCR